MSSDAPALRRRWSRKSRSNRSGWGNFGAEPNPPSRGSNIDESRSAASAHSSSAGFPACARAVDSSAGSSRLATASASSARLADDIVTPRLPGLDDGVEYLSERGQPVAGTVREVRAGKKREPVRGGEDAHRPAAAPGGSLHRLHVDRVEVRPLFPVDLHAHEMPVHHIRRRRVREGLVAHDVAPVARGIADRDEKWPVQLLRAGEGLVAPRVPVDGIAGVLAQVRACLATEPVHRRPPRRSIGPRSKNLARARKLTPMTITGEMSSA